MMEQRVLISIALCTYNGARYLRQQLDTLVNQTYANLEIVVADDGSTDDTFAILTEYADRDPRIKLYRNAQNLGFVKNFERCTRLCQGELIALCDQDDIWDLRKIELQAAAIQDHIFVYHDSEFINEDGSAMNRKMSDLFNMYEGGQPETFLFSNCVSGHQIMMKRILLDDALPLKDTYFHDWWLAYVATNIGTIGYMPQCLVKYRQHSCNDTDVLRLKNKEKQQKQTSADKISRIYQWLKYCKEFPKNKNQALVDAFYAAYTKRMTNYISLDLSRLLFKYRKTVLAIRKKGALNMTNHIYSQIWGLKSK